MFRTRDFFMFSIVVAFLLLAIITTISINKETSWLKITFTDNNVEYKAVVPEGSIMDREEKLTAMREKISESEWSKNLASVVSSLEEEKANENEVPEEEEKDFEAGVINLCSSYSDYSPAWSTTGLKFEVVEGARIVYRDLSVSGMATDPSLSDMDREIVMQLPLRSTSANVTNCLSSAVVGLALDGSLIKNSDYTAYKIFSAETLIGYALDGFPIYGLNTLSVTDQCGGTDEDGQYKYYLSNEREGMIGCFSSEPISF